MGQFIPLSNALVDSPLLLLVEARTHASPFNEDRGRLDEVLQFGCSLLPWPS